MENWTTTRSSANSYVENLSFSFGNLCMGTSRVNNNGAGSSSLGNNYSATPPNGSLTTNQQVEYPHNIWAYHSSSNVGDDTMPANTGFTPPSISNNPFCVNAPSGSQGVRGCMLNNNNLDLNLHGGIASQKHSVVPIADSGFRYGTGYFGGFSNQQNLNIAGFCSEIFFESLQGNEFMELARDETGSKYLQGMLFSRDPKVRQKILEGTLDYIFELITDPYGHHLFERLIESCSESQLKQIVAKITLKSEALQLFIYATRHKYGSSSIKKLIRVLEKSPLIFDVMFTMSKGIYEIMIDRVGCNVVLKCLDLLDARKNEMLYQATIKHCLQLVTHEQGCISLNKFIDNMKGPYRDHMLNLISEYSLFLSQDPCGNFVLQHVLRLHNPIFTKKICSMLKGNYIRLSLQKGGSHVVETCLNSGGVNHVIDDLLKSNKLLPVALDPYGNYVIQTALKVTKETNSPFYQILLKKLEPHHLSLQKSSHGRNVFNLINNA